MSRDKQTEIDEMAKAICHVPTCEIRKNGGTCYKYCKAYIYAFRAVNADYRKADEVAREIFEEIDKAISNLEYQANTPRNTVKVEELKTQVNWVLHEVVPKTLAELKKKYESEKDNG